MKEPVEDCRVAPAWGGCAIHRGSVQVLEGWAAAGRSGRDHG